ncbi:hypothetical protein PoB_003214800 [Plakobranchus ocellatus]|uniref:Uncharacterized protein n=1 Tax=Plakobranchus ocellatus TaxID=259542 RepID=A0AAV4AFT6_9GAST|nr:hypothetical protein PoB_003214800 [Plakobranchus ocellatus]
MAWTRKSDRDTDRRKGPFMSHSNSEEMSSDDGLPHQENQNNDTGLSHHGSTGNNNNNININNNISIINDNGGPLPAHLPKERPPRLSHSGGSGQSSSLDTDDGDLYGLMQAKTQVLDLIRGLMVKDIQKFVDWLKTVRVQYSAGELIVLCSPVEKSSVEPIADDILVDRNGIGSSRSATPDRDAPMNGNRANGILKKTGSLDLSDKRQRLRKEASMDSDDLKLKSDVPDCFGRTIIKQVDFSSLSGVHCSNEEFEPMKVSIPSQDTLLLTMVPPNLQVMLHKKQCPGRDGYIEPLPERVFYSDSEMDVAEIVASFSSWGRRLSHQRLNGGISSNPMRIYNNLNQSIIVTTASGDSNYHHMHGGVDPALATDGHMQNYLKNPPSKPITTASSTTTSVQLQRSYHNHNGHPPVMVIPAAHRGSPSSDASMSREHYKEGRGGTMSMSGGLEVPSGMLLTPAERNSLKRVSSTGTPILKRQAHVLDNSLYPENLTIRRAASEDNPHQPTNLSMKSNSGGLPSHHSHPLPSSATVTTAATATSNTPGSVVRKESPEAKKARAERLADSLRYHQEILQNSPLIKRPGERNFSGFRHCYANTVHNHSVKPEPLDTSYS